MTQVLVAARQLLADLNDVLPIINVKGDGPTTDVVREMKKNAAVIVTALTPVHHRLEKVVASRREDMNDSFKGLIEAIPFDGDGELSDEQLVAVGAAAEMYAQRCREYASCKQSFNAIVNSRQTATSTARNRPIHHPV